MTKAKVGSEPVATGFLLLPQFSMVALSSSIEPLKMANQLAGRRLYECFVVGDTSTPVQSSSGFSVTPELPLSGARALDALFICSGNQVYQQYDESFADWLRGLSRTDKVLGALGTATYLLARAGIMDGYRCTIHWEYLASLRAEFPHLVISSELFECDKKRYSCAGGTAALDMFLTEIRNAHGADLADAIAEQFVHDGIRHSGTRQRVPLLQQIGVRQPKLTEAVTLMEANVEEPISLPELALHVGLSRRQLERLFQQHLQCVPTRYYLELRLERARQFLLQTSMPVSEIAAACGFSSAPHFSKSYRDTFGLPPRDERRRATRVLNEAYGAVVADGVTHTALRRTTAFSASAPV